MNFNSEFGILWVLNAGFHGPRFSKFCTGPARDFLVLVRAEIPNFRFGPEPVWSYDRTKPLAPSLVVDPQLNLEFDITNKIKLTNYNKDT